MLIGPRIVGAVAVAILVLAGGAAPGAHVQQPPLQLSDSITFIIPDAGPKPEPHDPLAGLSGGGGSAVEQPTDAWGSIIQPRSAAASPRTHFGHERVIDESR